MALSRSALLRIVAGAATAFSLSLLGFSGQALAADARLKQSVTVETADVRLGDLFDNAGDASLKVFGMAPAPGRSMAYSASYVQAKAKQAGLIWNNADSVDTVTITRGAAAPSAAKAAQEEADPFASTAVKAKAPNAGPAVADLKRGDSVQIIYRAPGIELVVAGKAAADASIGGKARAVNLRSNKAVDGVLVSASRIEAYSLTGATSTKVASLDNGVQ